MEGAFPPPSLQGEPSVSLYTIVLLALIAFIVFYAIMIYNSLVI